MARGATISHSVLMDSHDIQHTQDEPEVRQPDMLITVGRAVILLAVAAALGYVSSGLLLVGGVALSGCFFSCGEPHYVGGALAAVGFSVTTALAIAAAIAAFVDVTFLRVAVRVWLVIAPITAAAAVLIVAGVL